LFVPCSPDGACLQRSVLSLALARSPQKSLRLIGWILATLLLLFSYKMFISTPERSIVLLLKPPKEKPHLATLVNPELIAAWTLALFRLILVVGHIV
jgi:hypothetical protein